MILTFIDQERGQVSPATFEALTSARRLAENATAPLQAAIIGEPAPNVVEHLGEFGVSTLHVAQHDRLNEYAPAAYAQSIIELMERIKPEAVLALGTERGNEIMAHVGARTHLPFAANCIQVVRGEPFVVTRLRWGGSVLEEAQLTGTPKLLTLAPSAISPTRAQSPQTVTLERFAPNVAEKDLTVRVVSRDVTASGRVSLAEARVVVGGGRGVGSAEGFQKLEELADLLGGAVGGSRVVTGLGWRQHHDQIGQTGTRISPELYISCGVSGAIQHMVGAKGAKHILAINTDPDAPIMSRADYAVIGDLHQVIPAITAEIRKRRK